MSPPQSNEKLLDDIAPDTAASPNVRLNLLRQVYTRQEKLFKYKNVSKFFKNIIATDIKFDIEIKNHITTDIKFDVNVKNDTSTGSKFWTKLS